MGKVGRLSFSETAGLLRFIPVISIEVTNRTPFFFISIRTSIVGTFARMCIHITFSCSKSSYVYMYAGAYPPSTDVCFLGKCVET